MTQEQNKLLFELTRRKLEAELAAAEVESRLRRELMIKESEARVAAAVAAASAAAASTTAWAQARTSTAEEDDITGEVPPRSYEHHPPVCRPPTGGNCKDLPE